MMLNCLHQKMLSDKEWVFLLQKEKKKPNFSILLETLSAFWFNIVSSPSPKELLVTKSNRDLFKGGRGERNKKNLACYV